MEWTWVTGDSLVNAKGKYGIREQGNITNTPGAITSPIYPVHWIDKGDNLWIFKGELWRYNASANEWTWLKGDSIPIVTGNYGGTRRRGRS